MMTCSGEQQTKDEKRKGLFLNQKKLLDTFRNNGAISQAQYEKSLGDLITKMKMEDVYDKMRKDGETE